MPSVPQSLLWISLVVLWLFVLVPMLINKRDAVRRTSDVALATRVLNGGVGARLLKRSGPAAGHRSDPDWQQEEGEYADFDDDLDQEEGAEDRRRPGSVVVKAAAVDNAEPDYLDVEVVGEDSGALPVGDSGADPASNVTVGDRIADPQPDQVEIDNAATEFEPEDDVTQEAGRRKDIAESDIDPAGGDADEDSDQYDLVEDTAGLELGEDPPPTVRPTNSRRRRYDSTTADAVSARKYKFRRRVLITMALILVASATAAFNEVSSAWWVCGTATGVTVLYLAYLRRQTRIEEQVRRRRMQRMARAHLGVDNAYDREFDVVPSRLRHPGAAVLDVDDEDPVFEHLDYAMPPRGYGWPRDLPRASGQ